MSKAHTPCERKKDSIGRTIFLSSLFFHFSTWLTYPYTQYDKSILLHLNIIITSRKGPFIISHKIIKEFK